MKSCGYCGAAHPKADDGMEPCPSCGAATNMVITAKFINGLQPIFRRGLFGRVKRGIWINPATSERDVMTEHEFQALKDVPRPDDRPHARSDDGYPDTDATGQRFGGRTEIEAEVNAGLLAKQARLSEVEAALASQPRSLTDQQIGKLEEEWQHLRTFFWLARGGDRRGETFSNPSQDMSVEEIDLLAKVRMLDDTP